MSDKPTESEVQEDFDSFWAPIVCPNGQWDLEQVKKELSDYHTVMREVSEVYMHITEGRISKPNTRAGAVIGVVDEIAMRAEEEAVKGAMDCCEQRVAGGLACIEPMKGA
jgi:hypothetical protein